MRVVLLLLAAAGAVLRGIGTYRASAGVMQDLRLARSPAWPFVNQVTKIGEVLVRLNKSNLFDNKIYIAKQHKTLDRVQGHGKIGTVLDVFSGIGTYPPKPPPLVELQRNP